MNKIAKDNMVKTIEKLVTMTALVCLSGCAYVGPGMFTCNYVRTQIAERPQIAAAGGVSGFINAWWTGFKDDPWATTGNLVADIVTGYYAIEGAKSWADGRNDNDKSDAVEAKPSQSQPIIQNYGTIYYIGGDGSMQQDYHGE